MNSTSRQHPAPPVAIVGLSSIFAGSRDLLRFWTDIVSATDRMTDVPPHAWLIDDYYDPDPTAPDMTYARRGGFLGEIPFDPMEFGMPPSTIPATDTAQLIALIAAKRVLQDAGRFGADADHSRTSVILGVASATELVVEMGARLQHPIWRNALRQAGLPEDRVVEIVQRIKDHYQPWQESTFPGLLGNVVAGRIANRLNLGGSNYVTDAACASSISAVQAGLNELYLGDSDLVIAGGVDALNDILMYMCFSKTPAFSRTGDCRPFSEDADGTLIGEGVGMVALRRLEDAEADGDPIYAVIRGLGSSSDGKGSSVYAPQSGGQAKALRRAYEKAGYSPATVELVEAHGTATKAGDAAEAKGLRSVFEPANPGAEAWCALGSVKSQIGHTKAAAGAAGLIKTTLALHHRILPPTLKVSRPNPGLGLEGGPLYLNAEVRPWIRGSDHPRRASVSSFGFGGSNFHITLEEYQGPGRRPDRLRVWSHELIACSADTEAELGAAVDALLARLSDGAPLGRVAADAAESFRSEAPVRAAVVAATGEEATARLGKLREALRQGTAAALRDPDILVGSGAPEGGRIAFLFPGQGSQYVGMGTGVALTFDAARAVWDEAADLPAFAGDRLDRAVFPPPAFSDEERAEQTAKLTRMERAQPAIAATSLSLLRLLRALGVRPDAVAGHSFGEVSALAAAGRIPETELLPVARRRGELMAEAARSTEGAMIAVRSDRETVAALLGADSGVVIANDNAPSEVVLAGSVEAIEGVRARLQEAGLTSVRLPVASAFHSAIVAGSCEPFHDFLSSLSWEAGEIEVWANTTARPYPADPAEARRLLADQLASPVRFREMVQAMYASGVTHFVEVGPGKVLTGLVGRSLEGRPHRAVSLDDRNGTDLRAFWRGIARLAVDGVPLQLPALAEGTRVPELPAPTPAHSIPITGFNHARPYPPREGAAGVAPPNPISSVSRAMPSDSVPGTAPSSLPAPSPASPAASGPAAPVAAAPVLPVAPAASVPAAIAPAPASYTPPPAGGSAPAPGPDGVTAELHRATVEAHLRYQELMAESHRAFLAMAGQMLGQAPAIAGGALPAAQGGFALSSPAVTAASVPPALPASVPAAVTFSPPAPVPTPVPASVPAVGVPPVPEVAPAVASPGSVPEAGAGSGAGTPGAGSSVSGPDVAGVALAVVSEKTGYPVEMLNLDMEMEAELGIDSIKQVEILSELQARIPGLPDISPAELARLRTLRDVAEKLTPEGAVAGGASGAGAAPMSGSTMPGPVAATAAAPSGAGSPGAGASVSAPDVAGVALAVVSEKTGYPVEMLNLDMEMEAELGIDSIKQVEILSELQARIPGLPDISPAELARLRTLRDVAEKLTPEGAVAGGASGAGAAPMSGSTMPGPVAATAAAPSGAGSPGVGASVSGPDVAGVALAVVSEKTGYPVEMLNLDMEMEAELGIDSIKQVEILSELQARIPGLPDISPAELARLRTLRDVAEKLTPEGAVAGHPGAPTGSAAPGGAAPGTVDCFVPVLEVEARPGIPLPAISTGMEIEVTGEHAGLAAALVSELAGRGLRASVVDRPSAGARGVISLAALGSGAGGGSAALHERAVEAAAIVGRNSDAGGRLFVTVQSTGGDFGLSGSPGDGAWGAGVAGVLKTAAREWPGASLKAIDVADPAGAAGAIVEELLSGGGDLEVGIDGEGTRSVVRVRERSLDAAAAGPVLEPGAVVLVSGGARGVTARSALALAERWKLRLILVGRSELLPWPEGIPLTADPAGIRGALARAAATRGGAVDLPALQREASRLAASAELRLSLAEFEARGIETLYYSADIGDAGQLAAALGRARATWGPIRGVIHGAGVLRDKAIVDLTPDRIRDVFAPKVGGLAAILEATREDPIAMIALFSSVAARAGNSGQAAYAAANEVLNKVAAAEAHRRGPGCRVRSYNWGPWAGGMVDSGLAAHFERQGVALIGLEEGAAFFVEDLERAGPGVERVVLARSGGAGSGEEGGHPMLAGAGTASLQGLPA